MKRLLSLAFALAVITQAIATTWAPPVGNQPGGSLAGWAANTSTGVGVTGGIPTNRATGPGAGWIDVTASPYYCAGTDTTTSASITSGTASCTVGSASGFADNNPVLIGYPATYQMIITAGCTASAQYYISVDAGQTYTLVSLTSGMSTSQVATAIAAATYGTVPVDNWTVSVSGSTVTFTSNTLYGSWGLQVIANGTGVTCTISTVHSQTIAYQGQISSISGTTVTLKSNASATISGGIMINDDGYQIQAAISTAATANNGTVVYCPAGTYRWNQNTASPIGRQNNFTLRGSPTTDATIFRPYSQNGYFLYWGFTGGMGYGSTVSNLSGSPSQGTTTLTTSSTPASGFAVGELIEITQLSDTTIPIFSTGGANILSIVNSAADGGYGGGGGLQQKTVITAISGDTITIQTPLYWNLSSSLSPQIQGSGALGNMGTGIGMENFKIDMTYSSAPFGIAFQQCIQSWILDVHIYNGVAYLPYFLECFQCQMDHCYIDTLNHTGTNGAGFLFEVSSACLIQNCEFNACFPLVEMNRGSSGNVFSFCFGYDSTTSGVVGAAFSGNHGPCPSMNLLENSIFPNVQEDGYFGGAYSNTYFRNWLYGTSPGASPLVRQAMMPNRFSRKTTCAANLYGGLATSSDPNLPNFTGWPLPFSGAQVSTPYLLGYPNIGNTSFSGTAQPSMSSYWEDWAMTGTVTTGGGGTGSPTTATITISSGSTGSWASNFFGNGASSAWIIWSGGQCELPQNGAVSASGMVITLPAGLSANLPSNGTTVYLFAGTAGYQEHDLDVQATATLVGNWDLYNAQQPTEDSSLAGGTTFPASLCYSSKPSWLFGLAYPYIDPSQHSPVSASANAAAYRFWNNNIDPPPAPTISTGPFSRSRSSALLFHH